MKIPKSKCIIVATTDDDNNNVNTNDDDDALVHVIVPKCHNNNNNTFTHHTMKNNIVDTYNNHDCIYHYEWIQKQCQKENKEYKKSNWTTIPNTKATMNLPSTSEPSQQQQQIDQWEVDSACRTITVSWICQTIQCLHMNNNTAEITINLMDRYMSYYHNNNNENINNNTNTNTNKASVDIILDRTVYKQIVITCLYIAMKVHEPVALSLDQIIVIFFPSSSTSVSNNNTDKQNCCTSTNNDDATTIVTVQQLERIEYKILSSLCWYINPPTVCTFVHAYLGYCFNTNYSSSIGITTTSTTNKTSRIRNDNLFSKGRSKGIIKQLHGFIQENAIQHSIIILNDPELFALPASVIAYISILFSIRYLYPSSSTNNNDDDDELYYYIKNEIQSLINITDVDTNLIVQRVVICFSNNTSTNDTLVDEYDNKLSRKIVDCCPTTFTDDDIPKNVILINTM